MTNEVEAAELPEARVQVTVCPLTEQLFVNFLYTEF
jgi:hypothetical protein